MHFKSSTYLQQIKLNALKLAKTSRYMRSHGLIVNDHPFFTVNIFSPVTSSFFGSSLTSCRSLCEGLLITVNEVFCGRGVKKDKYSQPDFENFKQ